MRKNITRLAAYTLTAAMLLTQAAYADNTTATSQAPGSNSSTTSTSTSSSVVTPGTSNVTVTDQSTSSSSSGSSTDSSTAGTISQTGPTGSKEYNAQGYLVLGSKVGVNGDSTGSTQIRVIGPN